MTALTRYKTTVGKPANDVSVVTVPDAASATDDAAKAGYFAGRIAQHVNRSGPRLGIGLHGIRHGRNRWGEAYEAWGKRGFRESHGLTEDRQVTSYFAAAAARQRANHRVIGADAELCAQARAIGRGGAAFGGEMADERIGEGVLVEKARLEWEDREEMGEIPRDRARAPRLPRPHRRRHVLDDRDALGAAKFISDIAERMDEPGIATGLAWTSVGGEILFIEATRMHGKGKLQLTGQLGDVMKESAQAAISFVRTRAKNLHVAEDFLENCDVHIHIPTGGVPKDGPSAGVTMMTALVSLLTGIRVRHDTAMTGEITLRGKVLPVGGIKEKVLAAHRAGIKRVILPERCTADLDEVPQEVRDELEFVPVTKMDEVLLAALEEPEQARSQGAGAEQRRAARRQEQEGQDARSHHAAVGAVTRSNR